MKKVGKVIKTMNWKEKKGTTPERIKSRHKKERKINHKWKPKDQKKWKILKKPLFKCKRIF